MSVKVKGVRVRNMIYTVSGAKGHEREIAL